MIKGRENNKGVPSADLLVCFPTRAHLTLMPPKPICSPARPSEQTKRHHQSRHTRKKSMSRLGIVGGGGGSGGGNGGQASPLLWAKNKQIGAEISEPTSPKVTCAGQIKVRHKAAAATCKSWQSVMEEIERIHNDKRTKKRSTWMDAVGFKKDILHFLTCLRNIRLDFRCFGAFPRADVISDDEEEDEELEEDEDDQRVNGCEREGSRTAFSKWFMVLQENHQSKVHCKDEHTEVKDKSFFGDDEVKSLAVPPPNALLLMRCRSAPAKTWLEEKQEEERDQREEDLEGDDDRDGGSRNDREDCCNKNVELVKKGKNLKTLMEEEERNDKKESLVVMRYDTGLYKISTDVAKETWVVGGIRDPLSRSRSWKR